MPRLRSSLLLAACLFAATALPVAGQSVQSIVNEMKTRYEEQLATVDNYVIETNLYTSYTRKTVQDGQATYESVSRFESESESLASFDSSPASTTLNPEYLNRLAGHATLAGTETVNGVTSYRLHVDNPSAVNPDVQNDAENMDLYVDTENYRITRMHITMSPSDAGGEASEMTMDFTDYRTVDGLILPYTISMTMDLGLSEQQRQQMEQLKEKLEQMPEAQRKQMKDIMGNRFDQIQDLVTGGTTTIEIESVRVNEGIPEGVFTESSGGDE